MGIGRRLFAVAKNNEQDSGEGSDERSKLPNDSVGGCTGFRRAAGSERSVPTIDTFGESILAKSPGMLTVPRTCWKRSLAEESKMSESPEAHGGIQSPMKRRDFLKASIASSALAWYPGNVLRFPEHLEKTPTKLIDIHAHIVSADTQRYPIAPLAGERSDWSKERPVDFEAMTAAMDQAGIGKAALVQAATAYGYDCSYLADSVARAAQRFTGVFSVDMTAPDAADKLRYWAAQRKLGGLRAFARASSTQEMRLDVPSALAGLKSAQELELPVCISLQMKTLPQVQDAVKQFPKIRFVLDHMIEPPIAEGPPYTGSQYLFDLAEYPNVYLKLTTNNIRASHTGKGSPSTFFPLLVDKFGASRIAWGSNYPSSAGTLKEIVLEAQSALAVVSVQDREWIFARTAQSLYPALADR